MRYPMTYGRVIQRNHLAGGYDATDPLGLIKGDLRRLESDAVDTGTYTQQIADDAGVDVPTAVAVLRAFFGKEQADDPPGSADTSADLAADGASGYVLIRSDWTDCPNCSTADEHDHVCQPPCSCCPAPEVGR